MAQHQWQGLSTRKFSMQHICTTIWVHCPWLEPSLTSTCLSWKESSSHPFARGIQEKKRLRCRVCGSTTTTKHFRYRFCINTYNFTAFSYVKEVLCAIIHLQHMKREKSHRRLKRLFAFCTLFFKEKPLNTEQPLTLEINSKPVLKVLSHTQRRAALQAHLQDRNATTSSFSCLIR